MRPRDGVIVSFFPPRAEFRVSGTEVVHNKSEIYRGREGIHQEEMDKCGENGAGCRKCYTGFI